MHTRTIAILLLLSNTSWLANAQGEHDGHSQRRHSADGTIAASIGAVHFANSGNRAAQAPFQRGIALLHSFTYEEAARAFREAEQADPSLAVAYWGEALTYSHLLWSIEDTAGAHATLRRLAPTPEARLARAGTAREREFGAAVEAFFQSAPSTVRAIAFGDSVRHFAARHPDDIEAVAFGALGMLLETYQGGLQGAKRDAARDEAIALSERVFATSPRHPGGAHYLIHATDDPKFAARGLPAARAYARIAPSVEHALHMPSHIFVQRGLWPDLVASNERAWAASRAYVAREGLPATQLDFHSLAWLTYGYTQQGRFRAALATVDTADNVLRDLALPAGNADARFARAWQSFLYAMETGEWAAFRPSVPEVPLDSTSPRALVFGLASVFEHAIAASMVGDTQSASSLWLREYARAHPEGARGSPMLTRAFLYLDALSAQGRGDTEKALALLTRVAAAEDSSGAPVGPPTWLRGHELLAEALIRAGRPTAAVRAWERALALTPNRSAVLLGLARARAASGDGAGARQAYRSLLTNWKDADERPELAEARRALEESKGARIRDRLSVPATGSAVVRVVPWSNGTSCCSWPGTAVPYR